MSDDIASLQIRVLSDQVQSADRRLASLEATGNRTERSLGRLSGIRFGAVAAGLAAVGVSGAAAAAGARKATQDWLQYDKAIKEVNSITSQTKLEFTSMRRDVLDLSTALGVDATSAARGLYQALSAGVPRENSIDFLRTASKTAIAGVTSVDVAVDGLTNTMNAFKIPVGEAEMVADKLFATVVNGKTTFAELSANLSKASVPAAALGIDLDELLASVIGITKQGEGTAEAFTKIKATITALLDPSDELKVVYEQIGVESGRAAIQQLGYAGTLEAVRQAYDGNDAALVKALRSSEAYNGVLSVTGANLQTVKEGHDAVQEAAGKMGTAHAQNADTLENALNSLKSSAIGLVETMENSFGVIKQFSELLRDVAQGIGQLSGSALTNATAAAIETGGAAAAANIESRISELQGIVKAFEGKGDSVLQIEDSVGQGIGRGQALKEIASLRAELEKLPADARKVAALTTELEKLNTERSGGVLTEDQFLAQRELVLQSYNDEVALVAKANAATEEAAALEAKRTEEEKARRAEVVKRAEAEAKAAKSYDRYLDDVADRARDLATTERERLDLEIARVDEALANGKLSDEIASKAKANLEEQIRLLEERNAKASGGSGKKKSAVPKATSISLPGIDDPFGPRNELEYLAEQEEAIRASYERRREAILELTAVTEDERLALLVDAESRYLAVMQESETARRRATLSTAADFFGDIAEMASAFGKKGAKVAKAAAIAQTTIKTYESATSAYAALAGIPYVGPALGAAAAGAAIAAGFANIQSIRATDESGGYAGAYEHGGMIPSGRFGLVGEAGPELVQGPANVTSARTTAGMLNGRSQAPIINVTNYGASVETKTSRVGDRDVIDFIIREASAKASARAKSEVVSDVRKGGNSTAAAFESTFGLSRGKR